MIRKTIGLVFALGLVSASAYFLYMQAFHSLIIRSDFIIAALAFGLGGLAWLWTDYLRPLVGGKRTNDDG